MGQPRPSDWSALGLSGDPVPGNVDQIRTSADRHFRKVADLIIEQAARLRRIDSSSADAWDSESGRAFRDVANDLAGAIDKAEDRYGTVAGALETYATELDRVQDDADRVLDDAERAEEALRRAYATVVAGEPGTPEYDDATDDRQDAIDDAREALRAAQRAIEDLVGPGGAWSRSNHAAAEAIRAAIDDEMADEWYDTVKQWIHDARGWLNAIKDVLGIISMILAAVVIVILLVIPGVNIVALLVIGVVLAAITFAITAAQWFAGDATTDELVWAGVSLVLSIAGLKFAGPVAANSGRIVNSVGHSLGQSSRLAGGSYSVAYQTLKSTANSVAIRALDEIIAGGLAKLTVVYVLAPSPLPAVAAELFPSTALMAGVIAADNVSTISDGIGSGLTVVEMVTDWDGYVDNLDRIQVGSL